MKGALLTAALAISSAQGALHKMKLQKIPLSEQLVGCPWLLPLLSLSVPSSY